jgi:hypothetical protein
VNLADSHLRSFVLAPDEHLDIRLFDFYDRVPPSLLRDPVGRAAARRTLAWQGAIPNGTPTLLCLQRPEFVKCLEAVGATMLLPSMMGNDAAIKMSHFSLLVSPLAREVSFAAMRARLINSEVVRVDPALLESIRLPRTIIELGTSTIVASIQDYPEQFINKLKGTGFGNHKINPAIAKKVVNWCSVQCIKELQNVH